jgi:16S rRNA C967 or C1407 C5-methylase (RsmB/RsmF family)
VQIPFSLSRIPEFAKNLVESLPKEQREQVGAVLAEKDRQIEILANELEKKHEQLLRLNKKYEFELKKTEQLEEEKGRILTSNALGSLGKHAGHAGSDP